MTNHRVVTIAAFCNACNPPRNLIGLPGIGENKEAVVEEIPDWEDRRVCDAISVVSQQKKSGAARLFLL